MLGMEGGPLASAAPGSLRSVRVRCCLRRACPRCGSLRGVEDRKPRLLSLITLSELGGAQTAVSILLPGLVDRFELTLAAHGRGPLLDSAQAAGVPYVEL